MKYLIALLLLSSTAQAAPGWATRGDSADASGSTFICEGQGKSEDDALTAAQGICSDKICKVCGVEVESIVETKETLKGVDFQRKVVERCRRVRKSEPQIKYKSTDCGPDGCTSWIQIFYSAETAKQECPAYQNESFADPAACEADIETFKKVEGRTAAAYKQRREALDAALIHCDKIDVRPTPAILALDSKLLHGMDQFEVPQAQLNDRWGSIWYSVQDPDVRLRMSESKELVGRIRLVRDYVRSRELNMTVAEAGAANDLDTPAGIERLRAALVPVPPGSQYGAPDAHIGALSAIERVKTSADAISNLVLQRYPPDKIDYGMQRALSFYIRSRGHVAKVEWEQLAASFKLSMCFECVRGLLDVKDQGGPEIRMARFFEMLNTVPENRRTIHTVENFLPEHDPAFVLAAEQRLPPALQGKFDWEFWEREIGRVKKDTPPQDKEALLARTARFLADGPAAGGNERNFCIGLADKIARLARYGGDVTPVDTRVCSCLDGPLKPDRMSLVNKWDLAQHARKRKLKCAPPKEAGEE